MGELTLNCLWTSVNHCSHEGKYNRLLAKYSKAWFKFGGLTQTRSLMDLRDPMSNLIFQLWPILLWPPPDSPCNPRPKHQSYHKKGLKSTMCEMIHLSCKWINLLANKSLLTLTCLALLPTWRWKAIEGFFKDILWHSFSKKLSYGFSGVCFGRGLGGKMSSRILQDCFSP